MVERQQVVAQILDIPTLKKLQQLSRDLEESATPGFFTEFHLRPEENEVHFFRHSHLNNERDQYVAGPVLSCIELQDKTWQLTGHFEQRGMIAFTAIINLKTRSGVFLRSRSSYAERCVSA